MSKQIIPVIGLQLTVYGLEEYKALKIQPPVAVVFALHGRVQNMTKMDPICQALCKLNKNPSRQRHIIVVAFDHPNHGSRKLNHLSNFGWSEEGYANPNHAMDMWSMLYNSSRTISDLMDVLEHYLFGPQTEPRVQVWGVLGFSMGGHASILAAAQDPRLTVCIPIVGTADFLGLMERRLEEADLSQHAHLPRPFCEMVRQRTANLEGHLSTTKLLMISGQKDTLVPASSNDAFINRLSKVHQGKQGNDWKCVVIPGVGHEWCPEMIDMSVEWCNKWMVHTSPINKL
ncbi:Alpha/Beta hydrolase protein [Phycomyces nitens]|nr:Alpha/Beta hydrolase protein [Phycomyces nitens]